MITKRWIDGVSASQEEWDRIDKFLESRGWMSLNRETSRIWLAEEEGEIVGFFVLQWTPQAGPMYVVPSKRGSGLANELADDMLNYLIGAKARGWFIVADSPHVPAMCEARGMHKIPVPVYTTEDVYA